MISLRKYGAAAVLIATVAAGFAPPAHAAMMAMNCQVIGSGAATCTGSPTAFTVPGSAFYGDTFNAPTPQVTGAPPGYGFYDDFTFSIPTGASADSITSTISLGSTSAINNLDVRLYSLTGNAPPVLGTPSGTVIDGTLTNLGGGSMVDTLSTTLAAGTYVLEVRGNATGSASSYSGTLNVAPVPLPATLPLLLSGLGFLGGAIRRRTAG
jgi:hypothetical protein